MLDLKSIALLDRGAGADMRVPRGPLMRGTRSCNHFQEQVVHSRPELRERGDRAACAAAANCSLNYFREFAVRLPGLNADLASRIYYGLFAMANIDVSCGA